VKTTRKCITWSVILITFLSGTSLRCLADENRRFDELGEQERRRVPRLALVAGVETYQVLPRVPNAIDDADQMRKALGGAGFDVRFLPNPTGEELVSHMKDLARRAEGEVIPPILVFFFAGHGFQSGAFNYLVPRDAIPGETLLQTSVPVRNLLTKVERSRAGLIIFFLDSCRTPEHSVGLPASDLLASGFTTISTENRTLVGLAAKFNKPARSSSAQFASLSPYTTALSRYIPLKAVEIYSMLKKVKMLVEDLTGDQSPEVLNSTSGSFFFNPTDTEFRVEENAWRAAKASQRGECVDRFTRMYPDSSYLKSALDWLGNPANPIPNRGGEECPSE
jgi:uncharacterized caspase-like protein